MGKKADYSPLFLIKGIRHTIIQVGWKQCAQGQPTRCHGNSRVSGLKGGECERSLMNTTLPSQRVFTEGCQPEQGAPVSSPASAVILNESEDGSHSTY